MIAFFPPASSLPSEMTRTWPWALLIALTVFGEALVLGASSLSLDDICEVSYIQSTLPYNAGVGIQLDNTSISLAIVSNYTGLDSNQYNFCSLNFTYSHAGRGDKVQLNYWLPDPSQFKNRYLSTGGAGYKSKSATFWSYACKHQRFTNLNSVWVLRPYLLYESL